MASGAKPPLRPLLLLLCASTARAGKGYAISLEGATQMMSLSAGALDMTNAATSPMATGFTVMAWIKYRDTTSSRTMCEFDIISSGDSNFFNGFGGLGGSCAQHTPASRLVSSSPTECHHCRLSSVGRYVRLWLVVGRVARAHRLRSHRVAQLRHHARLHRQYTHILHGRRAGPHRHHYVYSGLDNPGSVSLQYARSARSAHRAHIRIPIAAIRLRHRSRLGSVAPEFVERQRHMLTSH